MHRILIIEDQLDNVQRIAAMLSVIPHVVIRVCTENYKPPGQRFGRETMPPKEDVIKAIQGADIIFLDGHLGVNATYYGEDLFPHCKDKLVIGTSTDEKISFGEFNFRGKWDLEIGRDHPQANTDFKNLMKRFL